MSILEIDIQERQTGQQYSQTDKLLTDKTDKLLKNDYHDGSFFRLPGKISEVEC